ncbi:carbonic anhydrase [Athelia psychrophila]|uniref:Carbonic anhydrase n=1 Tax=Athelia psychrophila TaxID=1759441 RepID=A0A166V2F9_9AGAM|nr:carbonic anhydrase [Fibularhizoctonia sp. CBS 109695]
MSVSTFGDKGKLVLPPAKQLTIVTCMDARIDPAASLGIPEGDAHIIRNAGGSAKDALRSIVISQRLLGTREVAVFHHTNCGMLTFSTDQLRGIVKDAAPGDAAVAKQVDEIEFLEFSDIHAAVKSDVEFLKASPLVLKETEITGWTYDVETGKIERVV